MTGDIAAARPEVPVSRALGRSQIYRFLALAFRYPEAGTIPALCRLAHGVSVEALGEAASNLSTVLSGLAAAVQLVTLEELSEQHVATFGHVTMPDCPLHETACGVSEPFQQAQTLADIAGFYRAFGLEVASGTGERADHLAIELEFMHYLAYREAYALERHGAERVALIRNGERQFLQDHLARWAPVVARAVAARANGVLGAAARVLEEFLADEVTRWGISPARLVAEGAPTIFTPDADARPDEGEDERWEGEL